MDMRNTGGNSTAGMPVSAMGNMSFAYSNCAVSGFFGLGFGFGVCGRLLFNVVRRAGRIAACTAIRIGVQAKYECQHRQQCQEKSSVPNVSHSSYV